MNKIKSWIQNWSIKVEFWIIFTIAFSLPLLGSVMHFLASHKSTLFSGYSLIWTVIIEIIILSLIGLLLYVRKWNFRLIGLNPTWWLTMKGFLLCLFAVLADRLTVFFVTTIYPLTGTYLSSLSYGNPSIFSVFAISIVNPLFEEVLVVGYIITTLEKLSTPTGLSLLASVLIRLSCHLYQGPAGAAGIAVIGFIFGYSFIKKRQLWPLVVAHSVIDLLSLMALAK